MEDKAKEILIEIVKRIDDRKLNIEEFYIRDVFDNFLWQIILEQGQRISIGKIFGYAVDKNIINGIKIISKEPIDSYESYRYILNANEFNLSENIINIEKYCNE